MGNQVFVGIKAQLTFVVCLVTLFCLGMLSVATTVSNRGTLLDLRKNRLSVIAELKSAQVEQVLSTLMGQVVSLSSGEFTQGIVQTYSGDEISSPGKDNIENLKTALETVDDVVACVIYDTHMRQIIMTTANDTQHRNVTVPDELFPVKMFSGTGDNISEITSATYNANGYLSGPYTSGNQTFISLTRRLTTDTPNQTGNLTKDTIPTGDTTGYLTVAIDAKRLVDIVRYGDRFSDGSIMAIVELYNIVSPEDARGDTNAELVFLLTGRPIKGHKQRLNKYTRSLLIDGESGAAINKQKFNGKSNLSMGYTPLSMLGRHWGVIIYQHHSLIYGPLYELRNMILVSVFPIAFAMCVATLLLSGWLVRPIKRLQRATEEANPFLAQAKTPVRLWNKPWAKRGGREDGKDDEDDGAASEHVMPGEHNTEKSPENGTSNSDTPKTTKSFYAKYDESEGVWAWIMYNVFRRQRPVYEEETAASNGRKRRFQVPGKVMITRRIKDELTDLTETFNDMTDELRQQYQTLEDRVLAKTEEIEKARVSAEEANEAKSLFIANITHELRTPLNGVLGMADLAMHQSDPQEIEDSLKVVFKSGELLLYLLNDLLSFSKQNVKNDYKVDEKEFLVTEMSAQVDALFRSMSSDNGIDLKVEILSQELYEKVLYGDMNRILQVVINLMSNSIKFTPKGGKVQCFISGELYPGRLCNNRYPSVESAGETSFEGSSMFTKRSESTKGSSVNDDKHALTDDEKKEELEVYDEKDENDENGEDKPDDKDENGVPYVFAGHDVMMVTFQVTDTGPGIAPHLQSKIFEPFVQGDLQFSERRVGAGLGLSICKQLANLMYGTVTMASELGKGSTFTFKIPLRVVKNGNIAAITDIKNLEDWAAVEKPELTVDDESTTATTPGDEVGSMPTTPAVGTDQNNAKRPPMMRNPSSRGSNQDDAKIDFPVKVLIAEDNKVNQEVLVRMLKLDGVEDIILASDGVIAVDQVRQSLAEGKPFDLVFMDVQMPNMDGIQATETIFQELQYQGYIVGVSAYADETNAHKCFEVGMSAFLPKPLRRPRLRKTMRDLLVDKSTNGAATTQAATESTTSEVSTGP